MTIFQQMRMNNWGLCKLHYGPVGKKISYQDIAM